MNLKQRKTVLASAISLAVGSFSGTLALADPVFSIAVQDVGSTLNGVNGGGPPGAYDPALDGNSGGFRFNDINPSTYVGVAGWTGDVGTGEILGEGVPNPTGSFSTGFLFAGAPFIPYTFGGGLLGEAIIDSGGAVDVNINTLDFGGNFGGNLNFNLPPDPGTLNFNFVEPGTNAGEFLVSFQWEHYITSADDPSGAYVGFNARWIVEGVATVVDSEPLIFINDVTGNANPVPGDVTTDIGVTTDPYVDPGAVCQDVVDGDVSGSVNTVITPDPPPTENVGDTFTVDYTCTDSQSNVSTATRTVNVTTDTEPPVIVLGVASDTPGRSDSADGTTVEILVGVPYVDAGATCNDNFDGVIGAVPPSITGNPSFIIDPDPPLVDTSSPSTDNLINFTCTDSNTNQAQAIRTVDVLEDGINPVITLSGANPLTVAVNSVYNDPGAICTDENPIDPDPIDISANLDINPTTIDTSTTGTTIVSYNCADASGNPADTVTRTVDVVSGQNFEIRSMTITDLDGDGLAGCFKFNELDPTTCAGAALFSSDDSGDEGSGGTARILGLGDDKDDEGNPIGLEMGRFQLITDFRDPNTPPVVNTQSPVPVGPIAPGFLFTSFPFVPTTFDPNEATGGVNPEVATVPSGFVTLTGSDSAVITMQSLPWGGLFNSDQPNLFFLDPDEGTFSGTITAINDDDDGETRTFNYSMTWNHLITDVEDPTGQFPGFDAFWRLEGVITTSSDTLVINNPPVIVDFNADQDTRNPTTIITSDGGLVTVSVDAQDVDGDDLIYDWSQNDVQVVGATDQASLSFDPAGLDSGPLAIVVTVTDVQVDPNDAFSVTGQVILTVTDTAPVLSDTQDSDFNGISDADEGFGDGDFDGIADFQDPIDGNIDPGRNRIDFSNPSRGDIVSSNGNLRLGSTASAVGGGVFVVTEQDIGLFGGPGATATDNSQDRLNRVDAVGPIANGIRDFIITGLDVGATVRVVIPQDVFLPSVPEYRKYTVDTGWIPFSRVSGNAFASAAKVSGVCPGPDDPAYDTPVDGNGQTVMVTGDECVRLTLVDGGSNDADRTRNGTILDPGTVSSNGAASSANDGKSTVFGLGSSGGCTMAEQTKQISGDWWLVLFGLMGLLGLNRKRDTRAGDNANH